MQEVGHHRKISCKRSPLHGWGVFADEPIESGVFIETAPGIIVNQKLLAACYYVVTADGIPPSEIVLDQYGLGWTGGCVFFPLGWCGLYNHSDKPSAEFVYVSDNETLGIRSLRQIEAGEEITVNYGHDWWKKKPFLKKA
jgi:SET domain-containing protein